MITTFLIGFLLSLLIPQKKTTIDIVIVGTNDFHGGAFPRLLSRQDTGQKYNYGGLVYMARIIDIIRSEYENRFLYFDAGDEFQGNIQSSSKVSSGQILNDFYNTMHLNGAAFGNHQFDYGPQFLDNYLSHRNSPTLVSNLRSQKGQQNFLRNHQSSRMYQLEQGIKIGVIGLTTVETQNTSDVFNGKIFPKYKFEQYKQNVLKQSSFLREKGAHAILILSHVGNQCHSSFQYANRTVQTKQSDKECQYDQMSRLLDDLPPGTIDGVVQGHRHYNVHQFYKKIPIMGNINGGFYVNAMYLTFDINTKQIVNSKIEGPIPVCEKVFENTKRCNYLKGKELQSAGKLVNWKFHDKEIYAHPQVDRLFKQKWSQKMGPYLVEIASTEITLSMNYQRQNQLGNLITNFIHEAIPHGDFVFLNSGSFRTFWLPGIIQYQHLFGMFPYDNILYSFEITGKQLIQMLSKTQGGAKAFYQSWGLKQNVALSRDGRIKTFLNAQFSNGNKIINQSNYIGVTIDYLINGGGDDFVSIINKTYIPRNVREVGNFRKIIEQKLIKYGKIKQNTLIDSEHPRLIVEIIENNPT